LTVFEPANLSEINPKSHIHRHIFRGVLASTFGSDRELGCMEA
jgi:hypothetical protein